jgi:hypothetical protein
LLVATLVLSASCAATPSKPASAPKPTDVCAAARLLVPKMTDRDPCFEAVSLAAGDAVIVAPRHDDASPLVIGRVRHGVVEWRAELPDALPDRNYKSSRVTSLRALANDTLLVTADFVYWGGAGAGDVGETYRVVDRLHVASGGARSVLRALVGEHGFGPGATSATFTLEGADATPPAKVTLFDAKKNPIASALWNAQAARYEPWFLGP